MKVTSLLIEAESAVLESELRWYGALKACILLKVVSRKGINSVMIAELSLNSLLLPKGGDCKVCSFFLSPVRFSISPYYVLLFVFLRTLCHSGFWNRRVVGTKSNLCVLSVAHGGQSFSFPTWWVLFAVVRLVCSQSHKHWSLSPGSIVFPLDSRPWAL